MNKKTDTAQHLIDAAIDLFSQRGYDGTSVRAITARAGANLGAITYHFGSKQALFDAALRSVTIPIREQIAEAANSAGAPLTRIERVVRVFFEYIQPRPEFSNMIAQQLAGSRPMPVPARDTLRFNLQTLITVIEQGQEDGSIRAGNPRNLALSVASQPLWLMLARRLLMEGAGVDQDDPSTQAQIVESVVQFVRAGLQKSQEGQL